MSHERPLGLMVRCAWGAQPLQSVLLRPGDRPFTIGSGEGVDFVSADAAREVPRFTLAADSRTVRITRRMTGTLWRQQHSYTLQQAIESHQAEADGDGYALTLGHGDAVRAELGGVSFEAFRVRPPPRVPAAGWNAVDLRALNIFLATFFFAAAAAVAASLTAADDDVSGDGLSKPGSVAVRLRVLPPPRQTPGGAAPSPQLKAEPARAARQTTPVAQPGGGGPIGRARDVQAQVGEVLRGLGGALGGGGLSDALRDGLGHLGGAVAGVGLEGLALRGGTEGSGGGDRIGFGGVQTLGRGGGHVGYGSGTGTLCADGQACKARPAPRIDPPQVTLVCGDGAAAGCLDKELIRRVIRAHLSQIRYCYESQLTLHPGLQGKVSVRFLIGLGGGVTGASVASSTVGDPTLEACVASRVDSWQFPPSRGQALVTYPFVFQRAGP